jgi:hypothetical protein
MPISVSANLQPKNHGTFYVVEDVYLKGGFQVRDTFSDLATINVQNLKAGMLVFVVADNKTYQLATDLITWAEYQPGGAVADFSRKTTTYTSDEIAVTGFKVVALDLGNTILVHKLSVSVPITVEAFETVDLTDTNPYKFIPTADHLSDDGTTLLSSGDVVKNRRYTILTNQDSPTTGKIYFRLTNNTSLATAVTITVQYVTIE